MEHSCARLQCKLGEAQRVVDESAFDNIHRDQGTWRWTSQMTGQIVVFPQQLQVPDLQDLMAYRHMT